MMAGVSTTSRSTSKSGKRPAEDPPDGELQRPSRPPPAYSVPDEGGGAAEPNAAAPGFAEIPAMLKI